MSNSTTKKVCVRLFGQRRIEGYVYPRHYRQKRGIELMARSAEAVFVPYEHVRAVYFIREFGSDLSRDQRKLFATRPKLGGLWVRMRFLDGEELEGVIPNDLRIMGEHGVTLTPPDSKGNTQKVFVPGRALDSFVVMGVIGRPYKLNRPSKKKASLNQIKMFPKPRAAAAGRR